MSRRSIGIALLTCSLIAMSAPAVAGLSYQLTVGSHEKTQYPNDVVADDDDNFYFFDLKTNNVVKYHLQPFEEGPDGELDAVFVSAFGGDRMYIPTAIAYGNDMLYVTNGNNDVVMFDTDGTYLGKFGEFGRENGQFDFPSSIAIDPLGFVYVLDARNQRVQKFTPDGDYVSKFGTMGDGDGEFSQFGAIGMTIDADGNIYVADEPYNRITKFSSAGKFILDWGTQGVEKGHLYNPDELAVDRDGNILVAEAGNRRVQKFNPNGESLGFFTGTGQKDSLFNSPHGVAADAKGRVYVASSGESKVYVYRDAEPELQVSYVAFRSLKDRFIYKGSYNQSFESCTGSTAGRVTLGAPVNDSFSVSTSRLRIKQSRVSQLPVTIEPSQTKKINKVLDKGNKATLNLTFKFDCTDKKQHTVRDTARIGGG